ncbi:MAG: hypothetical protein ACKOXF_00590 [Chitinophagaceae bacterium]
MAQAAPVKLHSDSLFVEAKVRSKKNNQVSFSDWRKFGTKIIDQIQSNLPSNSTPFNQYGSNLNLKQKATGFFRTEKINGKWWTIDPDGYAGLHIAVNSIQPGKSNRNIQNFSSKFGNDKNWAEQTALLIQNNGFNGAGSWSETDRIIEYNRTAKKPIAYTVMLNFMSEYGNKRGGTYQEAGHKGYPNNTIFVFDPEFETFCDQQAKKLLKYKDDKNLFGYFTDNELPFSLKNLEDYLSLANKKDPGYVAAKKWLDEKGIAAENIRPEHQAEFLGYVANRYFSIVTKSIRKYDPNHLCLGSRFYSGEKNVPQFMQAAGKYIDVVSINYYGVWTPSQKSLQNWEKWSGKPAIITEFYVKAEDSGLANQSGAGWIVRTQADRGLFYQNFCLGLLQSKTCIGWHWFKYQDNDPTYTKADPSNNDANKGIVNNNYESYDQLLDQMKKLNWNRFNIIDYFNQAEHDPKK